MSAPTPTAERYRMMFAVHDELAADPDMLAMTEDMARTHLWTDKLARDGGTPLGEPELGREDSPTYGWTVRDEDGQPVLDEDGTVVTNPIRFYIVVTGWAERHAHPSLPR